MALISIVQLVSMSASHLVGSRIINLQKLHNVIQTITQHTLPYQSPVELIGEAYRAVLGITLSTRCNKCNEEILFKICNKVELKTLVGTVKSTCEVNVAALIAQKSVGGSHSNLKEVMCAIDHEFLQHPSQHLLTLRGFLALHLKDT